MGAIVNGMALHGGVIPYGATFLVFSDYVRPAMRLAALMQTPLHLQSSPTTASASARTGPPTSRWSTCWVCVPSRICWSTPGRRE